MVTAWLAAVVLAMGIGGLPRLAVAQEPSPPETLAPDPDPQPPAADMSQQQEGLSAGQAVAPQPQNGQPGAAAPETPKWPVNEQPNQAKVTWDSHGLSVDASNSSLQQILKDYSAATGAKVEGLSSDERVFGAYGPGRARDVLSQLLQGAGYNVIMIGDLGEGAPRQILLSVRRSGDQKGQPNRNGVNNNSDDEAADNEPEEPPAQAPPMRPGFPGGPGRTPQEMLQERQERLQQLQQRNSNIFQQNQQQQPPQQQPQN